MNSALRDRQALKRLRKNGKTPRLNYAFCDVLSDTQREVEGNGLLVFVDGYTTMHVSSVKQDLEDIFTLRKDLDIVVVTTARYQRIFANTDFPVFVLPEKSDLSGDRIDVGDFVGRTNRRDFVIFIPQWSSSSGHPHHS